MGNFSKQIETQKEYKERDKISRETLGKFFYDLAKLVFATMTLVGAATLITDEVNESGIILMLTGLFFTTLLAMIGYKVLTPKK